MIKKIEEYNSGDCNCITNADVFNAIKKIPDNSIDCVITSPPYNKGYFGKKTSSKNDTWKNRNIEYDNFDDNIEWEEYEKQQTEILKELVRVIKPNGSIFYNHKPQPYKHKLYFPEWEQIYNLNLK